MIEFDSKADEEEESAICRSSPSYAVGLLKSKTLTETQTQTQTQTQT